MKSHIIFLLVILSCHFNISAQDCSVFHQYQCVYADYTFFYSRQSKSTLMYKGETTSLNMVAYGGEEYYISVCGHKKFGNIRFKVLIDNDNKTVIYDNATDGYSNSIEFLNENTRNLIIEVSVPGEVNVRDKRCVGVLIQFREMKMN